MLVHKADSDMILQHLGSVSRAMSKVQFLVLTLQNNGMHIKGLQCIVRYLSTAFEPSYKHAKLLLFSPAHTAYSVKMTPFGSTQWNQRSRIPTNAIRCKQGILSNSLTAFSNVQRSRNIIGGSQIKLRNTEDDHKEDFP